MPMVGTKFRFRFEKAGDLRLLSHHDLMRCVERMLRRADLPVRSTLGFHPAPRIVFALSLPLNVVGRNEVVEIELLHELDGEHVRDTLNRHAPIGLLFTSVRPLPMKATAVPRRMVYRLPIPPDREHDIADRAAALLADDKVWIDRYKPRPRRINIRPYLRGITAADGALSLDLWVTTSGTARADELLDRLAVTDLWHAGAVLERTELELHDEPSSGDDAPPTGPAETLPLNLPESMWLAGDDLSTVPPSEDDGIVE